MILHDFTCACFLRWWHALHEHVVLQWNLFHLQPWVLGFPLLKFFTAPPLGHLCMSGRGAAPPCISLFDLVSDCIDCIPFGLHGFDASAFTSFRTSYRLLGWVTFVHHSVGKHVRLLPALGYDSLEYFIFYVPLNTLGLVT